MCDLKQQQAGRQRQPERAIKSRQARCLAASQNERSVQMHCQGLASCCLPLRSPSPLHLSLPPSLPPSGSPVLRPHKQQHDKRHVHPRRHAAAQEDRQQHCWAGPSPCHIASSACSPRFSSNLKGSRRQSSSPSNTSPWRWLYPHQHAAVVAHSLCPLLPLAHLLMSWGHRELRSRRFTMGILSRLYRSWSLACRQYNGGERLHVSAPLRVPSCLLI